MSSTVPETSSILIFGVSKSSTYLGTLTLGTSSAENVGDLGKLDWGGGLIHVD